MQVMAITFNICGGIQTTNRNFKCDGIKMSGNKAGDGGDDFFLFGSE